ncbi:Estrogen-related receptor gamma [Nibea albiflora]|uniref:Estrogen-related receptor gamma n=1 Tax=Nibea albiflora TaxID=240163 RepID=A0ACB7EEU1_NIBAL|nr:Estrogen-related receptor gamma [Nibea albiflora]
MKQTNSSLREPPCFSRQTASVSYTGCSDGPEFWFWIRETAADESWPTSVTVQSIQTTEEEEVNPLCRRLMLRPDWLILWTPPAPSCVMMINVTAHTFELHIRLLLDSSSSSSPAHEVQSSASSSSPSSSSSSSSSYGLLCGALEPDSPSGSSSSGGSAGGGAVVSEASVRSFSAQVKELYFFATNTHSAPNVDSSAAENSPQQTFYFLCNIEYSCPVMNECEITKRRRKACQACRFQKCLQAGMMREGVRLDRVRGGRQKYKRRAETSFYAKSPYPVHAVHAASRESTRPPGFHVKLPLFVCLITSCLSGNKLISHLLLTEPAPLAANQDDSTNDGSLRTLLTLCDLLNRELLVLIGWAKQIPGFSGLSLVDQMSLLQSGWMEALLVGVAWRTQGASGEELVFAGNLRLDEAQCRAAGLADLYEALRHLTAKYQAMNLSAEEAAVLKAVALANSDASPVDCPDSVQRFQDGLHEALQEYESSRREQHRAGRLLMSLPLLRQTADRAVEAFLRLHRHHRVPLHKLLLEMLDAKA